MTDLFQDSEVEAWARGVLNDMAPKLAASACVVSLVPSNEGDVKFWVELGAAIMMDKPIIGVVLSDRDIPPKLRLVADEIVVASDMQAASKPLQAALSRIIGTLNEQEKVQ